MEFPGRANRGAVPTRPQPVSPHIVGHGGNRAPSGLNAHWTINAIAAQFAVMRCRDRPPTMIVNGYCRSGQ